MCPTFIFIFFAPSRSLSIVFYFVHHSILSLKIDYYQLKINEHAEEKFGNKYERVLSTQTLYKIFGMFNYILSKIKTNYEDFKDQLYLFLVFFPRERERNACDTNDNDNLSRLITNYR